MYKKIAIGLFALFIISLIPATAVAQQRQGSGFRVSPVREEMTLDRGKSEKVVVSVMNLAQSKVTADVLINDFEPSSDESGQPQIIMNPNASSQSNSFKKIASTVNSITLEPRQTKDITVNISIPNDANPGGYYGALRFADSTSDGVNSNVALSASVGTLFLVTVPGNLKEKLDIVEFTAAKNGSNGRFFINAGDMTIVTRLQNTGNIHVKPFGTIKITDSKGKTVEEYPFNETDPRTNVLPDSTRKYEDKLKNTKWFGKYSVTANLGYGTSGNLLTAKTTFWVVPIWAVITAVGLLVAIALVVYLIFRKIQKKRSHKVRVRR